MPHRYLHYGGWIVIVGLLVAACGVSVTERTNTGNSAYSRSEYDAALQAYQDAQVVAPDEPRAYFNAALAYVGMTELEGAATALEQALRTADTPMQVEAYYNLGNVFSDSGMYDLAIDAYQQALLRDPEHDNARYNLELALLRYTLPSPTAQEQQTEPEQDETDPSATPTNQPAGIDGPTPTPPPQDFDFTITPDSGEGAGGDDDSTTPVPQSQGEMTLEQAEQLLDQVQQNQEALSEYLEQEAASGEDDEKDW